MYVITKKQQIILDSLKKWCLDHKIYQGIDWKNICDNIALQNWDLDNINDVTSYVQTIRHTQPFLQEGRHFWQQCTKSLWTLFGDIPSKILYSKVKKGPIGKTISFL